MTRRGVAGRAARHQISRRFHLLRRDPDRQARRFPLATARGLGLTVRADLRLRAHPARLGAATLTS